MIDFPNNPTLDQVFSSGNASWKYDGTKWIVATTPSSYATLVPTTGQTLDITNVAKTILNPAGVLAALTLRLPTAFDGCPIRISTRRRITALTLTAWGGQAVDWPVGELPANGVIDLTLATGINAWVRA